MAVGGKGLRNMLFCSMIILVGRCSREFEVSSDKYLEKVLTPTLRNSLKCTYR